jgi:hypothetical protein
MGVSRMSKATTSAYRGLPDEVSRSILKAGTHAEEHGWTVRATYTTKPPTIVLRFGKPGACSIYASWHDGRFHSSYTQGAQRLGYGDLISVLEDPDLLVPEDPSWPFGPPEDTKYYQSDQIACGQDGHRPETNSKGETKCSRCRMKLGVSA